MLNDKLAEIVAEKNSDLERAAVAKARQLIDEIATNQHSIEQAQQRIVECRNQLRGLQVQQLDVGSILGG
jgi:hypothetical protein